MCNLNSAVRNRPPAPSVALTLGLILLAFGVRLWGLDSHSLWLDEAQLLARSLESWRAAALGRTSLDLGPPLYPLIMHIWTRLGEPDFYVRFPSVVFSTLAVATLTRLRPRPVGLLAALLFALSPTQIYYAQEVTYYALMGLLAAAAFVLTTHLVAWLEQPAPASNVADQTARRYLISLAVIAFLSAYTYYGLAFLLAGLYAWLMPSILQPQRPWVTRYALSRHLVAVLACLPLLPLWRRQAEAGLAAWWGRYGVADGWQAVSLLAQGVVTHGLSFALFPFNRPPDWVLLALLGLLGVGLWRRPLGFLAGLIVPLGLAYLAAIVGRYPFEGRYLLFCAPVVYNLLAQALVARPLPEPLPQPLPYQGRGGRTSSFPPSLVGKGARGLGMGLLLAILLTASPQLNLSVPWAVRPYGQDTRSILAHIRAFQQPDDAIYVTYGASPAVAHYQRLGLAPSTAVLEEGWPSGRIEYQASRVLAAGLGHPRLWILLAHAQTGEEAALAEALTRRGAYLVDRVTAPGAVGLLWHMEHVAPAATD